MEQKAVNILFCRPDRTLLETMLSRAGDGMVAVVVRLAWQLGLRRQEIHQLTWEQIDLETSVVRLPDREIPIPTELQSYLQSIRAKRHHIKTGPVVLTDRDGLLPIESYLSYVVRQWMNSIGQPQVRLLDLRYDFMEQQLQKHDLYYVCRVAGITKYRLQLLLSEMVIQYPSAF